MPTDWTSTLEATSLAPEDPGSSSEVRGEGFCGWAFLQE